MTGPPVELVVGIGAGAQSDEVAAAVIAKAHLPGRGVNLVLCPRNCDVCIL